VNPIRQRHQMKKDIKGAEYLCGFSRKDRLLPVITLVLYVGETPWDGAVNLREMVDMYRIPEKLRDYVQDYHIHVLDVCHISEERLQDFPPDIRFMFQFMKNQKDKNALKCLLENSAPETISDDTYIALADYTGEPGLLKIMEEVKKVGGVDMCQAIREMVEDGRRLGEEEGRRLGKEEGRRLGEQRFRLLMTYMCDAGESDMIVKVVKDEELLQEMYRKYQI
ncbi:MAG: Rpn family recombination-promoting nuclease/putative transposase, partial [Clostridiales bacterium]|nr:Rpn family recombination-promoting nuclease/putative transposase [Clostridiales bacterium]